MVSDELIAAQYVLIQPLSEVRVLLNSFISDPNFSNKINLAFSLSFLPQASDRAREIISQWLAAEEVLPRIEIVSSSSINSALGAYAAETDTIYLSQEFLIQNQDNLDRVGDVLLEELGHALSHQLNPEDALGDEGAIFSLLVQDKEINPETLAELKAEDDTVTVTLNNQDIQLEQAQTGENPAFDLIGLTDLRNDPNFAELNGTGFDVVIIDSGLDLDHPLLDDNYRFGIDYIDGDNDPNDVIAHGTHVSGIIGAEDENIGVAPDVGLIALKVGDDQGLNLEAINSSLAWVLKEVQQDDSEFNIVAVNLSLGSGFYSSTNPANSPSDLENLRLIRDLEREGVVVVAAAGNDFFSSKPNFEDVQQPSLSSPAIYSTIAVGAVWQQSYSRQFGSGDGPIDINPQSDSIASFSQRLDAENFIFAPGALISSTIPEIASIPSDSLIGLRRGTSQAAPHVTGAVVLLQEIAARYGKKLTPQEILDYLIDNAEIVFDGDDENGNVTPTNICYPRINIYQSAITLRDNILLNNNINSSIPQATLNTALPTTGLRASIGTDRDLDVGNKDVDFYRINSATTGILEIDIDSITEMSITDPVDSVVVLFDANGNLIGLNDDADTIDSRLRYQIKADTDYYVAVTGFSNQDFDPFVLASGSGGDTGDYIFNSRLLPTTALTRISDNTINSDLVRDVALDQTIAGRIGEDSGYIIGAEDVDIYRFVATDDGVINIRVSTDQEYSVDTFLRLFDADSKEIDFNDDENSLTKGSFLQVEVEAGSEYYIGINGFSEEAGNYNPTTRLGVVSGSQGDYSLLVTNSGDMGDLDIRSENPLILTDIAKEDFLNNFQQYMSAIRDFDGNNLGGSESWKNIGSVDIQGDGDIEYIFVNPEIGRWATIGVDSQDRIDFSNYGKGGDTRVVGIYQDPLIATGDVEPGSPFDSQQRFQNDLYIDNLELLAADDYDGDGLQETYFRLGDGTAVLHAYMHADGNIQYANYQSALDLEQFMTDNGVHESVWGEWL